MKDTVFYVGGSKGGVGKSIISTVLVQFLIDKYSEKKTIHLIEVRPDRSLLKVA
jgi:anion-transporting  ArsA/GET3 family ATPase